MKFKILLYYYQITNIRKPYLLFDPLKLLYLNQIQKITYLLE